jgi:hypothetical protein
MNRIMYLLLKILRKGYSKIFSVSTISGRNWTMFSNKEYSNSLIYDYLNSDQPCMIARFGSTEMLCLVNYLGVKNSNKNYLDFIKGRSSPWWWEESTINQMQSWSGFFPNDVNLIEQFCELMMQDIKEIDVLGSWLNQEILFSKELVESKRIILEDMEPFFSLNPWTRALKGKKVLIVHPFAETINEQYKKRNLLFSNDLLPEFDLKTIKAVQSVAGEPTGFNDWFEALEFMKSQISAVDFDICIIGCGAYGLPLAAHVKRLGKKSIHLAGATQLLFGIKGKRWEQFIVWPYTNLFNRHWVRPAKNEKPTNAVVVEGACYW